MARTADRGHRRPRVLPAAGARRHQPGDRAHHERGRGHRPRLARHHPHRRRSRPVSRASPMAALAAALPAALPAQLVPDGGASSTSPRPTSTGSQSGRSSPCWPPPWSASWSRRSCRAGRGGVTQLLVAGLGLLVSISLLVVLWRDDVTHQVRCRSHRPAGLGDGARPDRRCSCRARSSCSRRCSSLLVHGRAGHRPPARRVRRAGGHRPRSAEEAAAEPAGPG